MITERRTGRNVPWVLAAGFTLTILLLIGSAWFGVRAVDAVETHSEQLITQHRRNTQLIDEIQEEAAALSGLVYPLAAGAENRADIEKRLRAIEQDAARTLEAARSQEPEEGWKQAGAALERFSGQARRLLETGARAGFPELRRAHEELTAAIARLVSANYASAVEQEGLEWSEHRRELNRALLLLIVGTGLAVICAVATVRVAVRMFRRTEWQAKELSRLSGHVLEAQEEMLHRFSRELHDEFGQSLTAIEANLAAVPAESPEALARLEDCSLLVKDLMTNVRELSQLLRPSTLDDFGLMPSLQWLAESFTQRTGIVVETRLEFRGRLPGETETHLFRIAQEALTNAARHSKATKVELALEEKAGVVRLSIADNGGGMRPRAAAGRGGLGLAGMRERMLVSGGRLEVRPDAKGVTVMAEVALDEAARRAKADPSLVGG